MGLLMELRRHSVEFGFLQGVVFCISAHLCEQGLTVNGKLYAYPAMDQTVEVRRGWFTKTLVWGNHRFSFFHFTNSRPLFSLALNNRLAANRAQLQVSFDDLLVDIEAFNHHFAKHQRYLRGSDIKQFEQAYAASLEQFSLEPHFSTLGFATDKLNCRLAKFIKQPQLFADKYNQWWQTQQLTAHAGLFDSLEAHPLTKLQRQACVIDENNTLVIAGAGTGKTSTMAAKAAYLVKQGLAKPEEILMLAYGKDARVELEQRTKAVFEAVFEQSFETEPTNGNDSCVKDCGVKISTFHAIGKEIIEYFSNGIAPNTTHQPMRVSVLASDEKQFTQFIDKQIDSIVADPKMADPVAEYFGRFLYPQVNELAFKSEGQYRAYLKNNEIRALSGDLVKSFQELKICNYLYTHGIEFEYEPHYRAQANENTSISVTEPGKGAYQPDFYIPKLDAYLEHFGIDKKGNTRPDIDKEAYNQSREWKIALHQQHDTCLLQTFSWQANIGELEQNLEAQLCQRCDDLGLPQSELFKPIAPQAVFEQVKALGVYRNISRLMASFVGLFKSSGLTVAKLNATKFNSALKSVAVAPGIDDIKPTAKTKTAVKQHNLYNQLRWKAFLHLFSWVIERYEAYLVENNTIDFSDMISKALNIAKSKAFHQNTGNRFRYKYIMVDEFQDISSERAQLVKALRDANPGCALFCVGDDWQAIYRFAGSDLNLTTEFERTFGTTQTISLDKTFRFNDQIEKVASRFIQANPAQLTKQLTTHSKSDNPQVCLLIDTKQAALEQAFASIVEQSNNHQASVMLISRFKTSLKDLDVWRQRYPQLAISAMSAHASKGKQADYVIVLDVNDDKYGFPSKIANDPILEVLLPKLDSFKDTEERRLFYVALSRAKQTVFVQAEVGKESSFVKELRGYGDNVRLNLSEIANLYHDSASCPECNDGKLIPRQGPYGLFYTCSLGKDYCDTKVDACPACKSGPMLPNQTHYICGSENCGHQQQICPQCLTGKLVQRTNAKSGKAFLACSQHKRGDATRCQYTCDLVSDKQSTAA
ncbi:UvrD-helicase domain-containing protein [Shewanella marinintestina]|uniref:UvrD-helicase domain-containing protein n=1 Tax=Shewanella marinintestina TaxID=190305 RepID=UPI00200D3791|nr:UvrD-helicase domain-containing protein [Shewanella marinintestina]MCL1145948.1 UvrD-helicase domain-containing protein [Shewanella marinintestina]